MPKHTRQSKLGACTECQKRKSKCSGSAPCSYCARSSKPCTFSGPPQRTPLTRQAPMSWFKEAARKAESQLGL
ncbi:hypothetical protein BDV26DRAFT_98803 [Aspergillus bertholletiae]|uniref:Zn(2)-C6 fungal-type domain-containing protein n=1 Tax=Aspergillus bertholletiae TaxID=1226010 RepID=A0A5N7AU06_9EURO|nr:hypothetical protein BDV26DRAFT_98803 [Aspergillus bertholletiae]